MGSILKIDVSDVTVGCDHRERSKSPKRPIEGSFYDFLLSALYNVCAQTI